MIPFIPLAFVILSEVSGLLLPMTKPDGSVDLVSLVSHVAMLEHMVGEYQSTTKHLESELKSTKDIQRSLEDELVAVKRELGLKENEFILVKSQVAALETDYRTLQANFNITVLDTISHDVKTNTAQIQLLQNSSASPKKTLDGLSSSNTGATTSLQQQQKEMKTDLLNMTSRLEQMESNFISSSKDVSQIKDSFMIVQSQMNATVDNLSLIQSDMNTLRRNVSGIANATLENGSSLAQVSYNLDLWKVAFRGNMANSGATGKDLPLKFNVDHYNVGNGYDTSTGKFTAPVSGNYIFSVSVEMGTPKQFTYIRILQSDIVISEAYGETTSDVADIIVPVTTITNVKKGEQVWVVSLHDVHITGGFTTYFVGALLSAD